MSANQSLKDFLKQKKEREESSGVDWGARKKRANRAAAERNFVTPFGACGLPKNSLMARLIR